MSAKRNAECVNVDGLFGNVSPKHGTTRAPGTHGAATNVNRDLLGGNTSAGSVPDDAPGANSRAQSGIPGAPFLPLWMNSPLHCFGSGAPGRIFGLRILCRGRAGERRAVPQRAGCPARPSSAQGVHEPSGVTGSRRPERNGSFCLAVAGALHDASGLSRARVVNRPDPARGRRLHWPRPGAVGIRGVAWCCSWNVCG